MRDWDGMVMIVAVMPRANVPEAHRQVHNGRIRLSPHSLLPRAGVFAWLSARPKYLQEMVCAEVVEQPWQWEWCGYQSVTGVSDRYPMLEGGLK
ncbi:MAG: hypothetical protein KGZ25_12745 [Planctomycetes bacterium]|nr:hypothetical protein [Planctomycetota bacterium]